MFQNSGIVKPVFATGGWKANDLSRVDVPGIGPEQLQFIWLYEMALDMVRGMFTSMRSNCQ